MANKRITDVDIIESLNGDESFFINQNSAIKQINKTNMVFGINNGGTGATTAAGARANLGAVEKIVFSSTLGTDWNGTSAPYTQTITIDGILKSDNPHITPVYSDSLETAIVQKESWGMVCKATTDANSITFVCFEDRPSVEIAIQVEVYR